MFKVLVLQVLYGLSDDQAEFQILDRRSFGRFLGLDDGDKVPDAKTIWLFREQLTVAGAVERLLDRFDAVLNDRGYLPMGGQIVDATVVEARRPRLTAGDDRDRRAGVSAKKNHIGIDRRFGRIRTFSITHAATHDGGQLEGLLDRDNLASGVWADAAYRSAANLALLDRRSLVPQFQRAKPRGNRCLSTLPAGTRGGPASTLLPSTSLPNRSNVSG